MTKILPWHHLDTHFDGKGLIIRLDRPWRICWIGPTGSGKTMSMTYFGIKAMALYDYNVWANPGYEIKAGVSLGENNHQRIKPCNSRDLELDSLYRLDEEIKNGVVCIDELPLYADSLTSASLRNRVLGFALMQSRKRKLSFFCTAQNIAWVFNRIRWSLDLMIECKDAGKTPIGRENKIPEGTLIFWKIYDMSGQLTGKTYEQYPFPIAMANLKSQWLWDCYDTNQTVDPFDAMRGLEIDLSKRRIAPGGEEVKQNPLEEETVLNTAYDLIKRKNKVSTVLLHNTLGAKTKEEKSLVRAILEKTGTFEFKRMDGTVCVIMAKPYIT